MFHNNKNDSNMLIAYSNFCSNCGATLPLLKQHGDVVCYQCGSRYKPSVYGNTKIKYKVTFNSISAFAKNVSEDKRKNNSDEPEGPVVERKCPKCGNYEMSYAALQLRSADEGQTVFYTCTKCNFKETENS